MRFLRQSTASQEILLGPFVAAADGTAQTGLTIANTDIQLLKGGATSEGSKNSGGGTHIAGGRYSAVLDATDTNTVGILEVSVNPASGIPFNKSYYVLEEAVYDALFAASAVGPLLASADGSTLTAINLPNQTMDIVGNITGNLSGSVGSVTGAVGSVTGAVGGVTGNVGGSVASIATGGISEASYATTAGSFAPLGIVDQGTAQSATGTTLVLRSAAAFADDQLIGATIVITGGSAGVGQSRTITDYVSSTDTATVETWTTTPTGTITYKIFATAPSTGGGGLDAAGVRAAIGMASADLDTQLDAIKADTAAILVDTGTTLDARIPAALVSGRMDVSVGAMAANVMTAAAAASDLTTELQSGLATAAELAKVPKSDSNVTFNATALASINAQADLALSDYDPPTNAEMTARTLAAASYATAAAQATAQADLDTLTGADGVTLATSQPNYAPATAAAMTTVDGNVDTILATTNKLDDTLEDQGGGTFGFTEAALAEAPSGTGASAQSIVEAMFQNDSGETEASAVAGSVVYEIVQNAGGGGSSDWDADERTAIRAILGIPGSGTTPADPSTGILDTIRDAVATRASQTSVDDLPTNAELATALGTADDAVLAAIAALNNLSSAQAQTAAAAALTAYDPPTRAEATSDANSILTAVGDTPTNAELATALAAADDAVLAAIAALNNVSVANILAATVEGSTTLVQSLRLLNAALGGKANGLETTSVHYRDLADTKDRILATVDADGNRSAVTLDLS